LLANWIEVAIFPDAGVGVAAVGDALGDALGDGVTVGEALATDELVVVVVVVVVEAFVLVSALDA
jgi:hypothetical protein